MTVRARKTGYELSRLDAQSLIDMRLGALASKLLKDSRKLAVERGILLSVRDSKDNLPLLVFCLQTDDLVRHLEVIQQSIGAPKIREGLKEVIGRKTALAEMSVILGFLFSALSMLPRDAQLKKGTLRLNKFIPAVKRDKGVEFKRRQFLQLIHDFTTPFEVKYQALLSSIERKQGGSPVIAVMKRINRGDFIPPYAATPLIAGYNIPSKYLYLLDQPLRIVESKESINTSRVRTVVFTLDELALRPGMRVLEIGTGCGWPTAIISELVGKKGEVCTIELREDLLLWAQKALSKKGIVNVKFKKGNGRFGWQEEGPFDRIIVWGAVTSLRDADLLFEQLAPGGKMVVPVGGSLKGEVYRLSKVESAGRKEEEIKLVEPLYLNSFGLLR